MLVLLYPVLVRPWAHQLQMDSGDEGRDSDSSAFSGVNPMRQGEMEDTGTGGSGSTNKQQQASRSSSSTRWNPFAVIGSFMSNRERRYLEVRSSSRSGDLRRGISNTPMLVAVRARQETSKEALKTLLECRSSTTFSQPGEYGECEEYVHREEGREQERGGDRDGDKATPGKSWGWVRRCGDQHGHRGRR